MGLIGSPPFAQKLLIGMPPMFPTVWPWPLNCLLWPAYGMRIKTRPPYRWGQMSGG